MKFTSLAIAIMTIIIATTTVKNGITTVVRHFRTFCETKKS